MSKKTVDAIAKREAKMPSRVASKKTKPKAE
jgi:hypothetical protein